jgi:hypothetical protein
MGQISAGETDSMDTVNGMTEINVINRSEVVVSYLQLRSFNQEFASGWQDAWSAVVGTRITPDTHWAISFQVERELTTFYSKVEQTILDVQLRYRF